MISFPSSAKVNRILPKEAFYKHLNLSGELKGKFVSDLQRVTLEYSLTAQTLNLELCEAVDEILLLIVELKKRDADPRLFEVIARQNSHRMIFLLRYAGQVRLAIYHSKLYQTQWHPEEELTLQARGTVKHIFFIAETKGTMDSLNLRPIEQAKIACAKQLFNEISSENVKYHDIDSYQSLLNIMEKIQ